MHTNMKQNGTSGRNFSAAFALILQIYNTRIG
jgi:hypothetical protein